MSETRSAGWWLPDPRGHYNSDSSIERTRRMKFFAAWVIRLVLLGNLCTLGLLLTEADLSTLGALSASGLILCASALALSVVIALVWSDAF